MGKGDWQALVTECRSSGKTAKVWCAEKGINYRRYVTWATKLNRKEQQTPLQWADVTLAKEERSTDEIKLICGKWTICVCAGFSPGLLSDILRVVDGVC